MDNKNRLIAAISSLSLFLMINVALFFSIDELLLVYHLSDVVVFSWRMPAILFSYPLVCYFCIAIFYYLFFLKMPKNNDSIFKILTFIGVFGIAISFPMSWYADLKLKEYGYVTCYKKSFNAPSKYVKNENLCN
ncbi:DUF1240 domain-containing protein [Xenorhabdus sp. IM139775]|uniref:DUF1240 domain-containing protein n=1 Tax=Xenorhabdus sp. IM139775 TaxID=3025876 RepID=UPI0023590A86|nr:DUF1240 domain-containing protein [Xenorhabdus sp. IM139775]MDC9594388.1 DUF1240 domain-containing protein [Xenorhabdus sp. IM139775]